MVLRMIFEFFCIFLTKVIKVFRVSLMRLYYAEDEIIGAMTSQRSLDHFHTARQIKCFLCGYALYNRHITENGLILFYYST